MEKLMKPVEDTWEGRGVRRGGSLSHLSSWNLLHTILDAAWFPKLSLGPPYNALDLFLDTPGPPLDPLEPPYNPQLVLLTVWTCACFLCLTRVL